MQDISFYDVIKGINEYNHEIEKDYLKIWLDPKKKAGDMIKELDKERASYNALSKEDREETDHHWKIEILREVLARRLGLYSIDTMDCFRDSINESLMRLDKLKAEIKELRTILKRHNHDYAGTYTSPARWVI